MLTGLLRPISTLTVIVLLPLYFVEDKVVQRQALLLTYGCFFAEFLEDLSLVRLGLLDLPTCVGLRYGSSYTEA